MTKRFEVDYRDLAMAYADNGYICSYEDLARMCLKYMSNDDVKDMLIVNELVDLSGDEYDGQPDWEQEWEDFGETYGDKEYI